MLDEPTACALLLAWLRPDPPMAVQSCRLSVRGTHWILQANTVAYVTTGDVSQALVGVGAYLVDRATGAIEAVGTWPGPDRVLEDRHDAAEAGTRTWVIRPAVQDAAALLRLRQWLGCPPAQARDLARGGAWFSGGRLDITETAALLQSVGLRVEVALVEDPGGAISLFRVGGELEDLRQALLGRPSALGS